MQRSSFVSHMTISSKVKPIGLWLLHCGRQGWQQDILKGYIMRKMMVRRTMKGDKTINDDNYSEFL